MQVNTEFWGMPETWATPSETQAQNAEIKLINWQDSRTPKLWQGGYNATGDSYYVIGDPPKPEKTPIAWGIGSNSAICKPRYGFLGYTMTDSQTYASPIWYTRNIRFDESKPLDYCPQYGNYGIGSRSCGWGTRVSPSVSAISSSSAAAGGILSFNYQNIIIYPTVEIAKSVTPSSSFPFGIQKFNAGSTPVSLDEYFSGGTSRFPNPAKDEYPYILAVKIGKWYLGGQPIYNGDAYVSGERNELTRNFISGRFNEQCKGREYAIGVELKYSNSTSTRHPKMQNDFYTLYPVTLYDSTLSGYCYNREGFLVGLQPNTALDDEQKAWIMADPSDGNYPVFCNNGKYEYRAVQSYYGDTYRNQAIMIALWENATKEEVLRDVAFLGFWFSEDETTARRALTGENCNDSKMHIPVFDSKGVTTGEWKSGTDTALEPNAKWGDPFNDSPYNPGGSDTNDDFGDLDSSIPIRGNNTAGLKLWVVSQSDLYNINAYLNGTYLPDITQSTADFKGSNPQEYIVSIQQYPFSLPHFPTKDYIHIGNLNTGVEGYPFVYDQGVINRISIVDFGSLLIPYYFQDFRDFESTIVIQLPFIGAYELDPRVYVGHTVSLKYNIDYTTGSVCAMIYRDNLIVETYTGNISISVPLFASNMGAYQNTLASLQFAVDQSKTKQIAGIAATALSIGGALAAIPTGGMSALAAAGIAGGLISGTSSMISGLIQQQELEYKIDHTQPHTASVSTASAANSFLLDDRARLLIYRPRMLNYDDAVYSHTVGNACCLTGVVGDFEGLIKCGNVDLSGIPATADEIKAIGDALANGVYV